MTGFLGSHRVWPVAVSLSLARAMIDPGPAGSLEMTVSLPRGSKIWPARSRVSVAGLNRSWLVAMVPVKTRTMESWPAKGSNSVFTTKATAGPDSLALISPLSVAMTLSPPAASRGPGR